MASARSPKASRKRFLALRTTQTPPFKSTSDDEPKANTEEERAREEAHLGAERAKDAERKADRAEAKEEERREEPKVAEA